MEKTEKNIFQRLFDSIEGDKVLLMIIIMLFMVSSLAIFSATSIMPQVRNGSVTRPQLFVEQLIFIVVSLGAVFVIYRFKTFKWFKILGRFSFLISLVLLLMLDAHVNLGIIRAQCINSAWRTLYFLGFQLHVFEVVKVLMILYLSWAVHTWKNDGFKLMKVLQEATGKTFFTNEWFTGLIYIFIPIGVTALLVFMGSVSSMLFITLVMFITIVIGGFPMKQTFTYLASFAGILVMVIMLWFATDGKFMSTLRLGTAMSRLESFSSHDDLSFDEKVLQLGRHTAEGRKFIDDNRQEIGSLIAIKEGILPLGPGSSTQKYKVPVMYGDYMYSLIVEEYGFIGGIIVIMLFLSLLARGSLIARNCNDVFARTAVGGITVMISAQAMMHIAINVGLMPMTGQTLPLISDGKSSMLMFSVALGIVFCISKIVRKQIQAEEAAAVQEDLQMRAEEVKEETLETVE